MSQNKDETIKVAMEWKLEGNRPRDELRKRWLDVVEGDLKVLGVGE